MSILSDEGDSRLRETAVVMTQERSNFYKAMLEQRGLTVRDVAERMGVSVHLVRRLLRPGGERPDGTPNRVPLTKLFEFEEAITDLTDRKGGVFAASGATPEGIVEMARMLRRG